MMLIYILIICVLFNKTFLIRLINIIFMNFVGISIVW